MTMLAGTINMSPLMPDPLGRNANMIISANMEQPYDAKARKNNTV
jgi:hypothetical protein